MRKKVFLVFSAAAALTLSSCSTGRYINTSTNVNMTQTQVILSEANFRVVKTVKATASYYEKYYQFHEEQLKQSAYAALLEKADMTGAQALVNVTFERIDRASGFFFPKYESSVIASGVVIEFVREDGTSVAGKPEPAPLPEYAPAPRQKEEGSNGQTSEVDPQADYYFLAYRYKSRELDTKRLASYHINGVPVDMKKVKSLALQHSTEQLKSRSKGYNPALEQCVK